MVFFFPLHRNSALPDPNPVPGTQLVILITNLARKHVWIKTDAITILLTSISKSVVKQIMPTGDYIEAQVVFDILM
jgi:hypothetical protein